MYQSNQYFLNYVLNYFYMYSMFISIHVMDLIFATCVTK